MTESDLNNQEICVICNEEDLEDNRLIKKTMCDCNIFFHNNCYNEYLLSCSNKNDMKCPVCRKQIELSISDIKDLDEVYYNKLNYAKCIFFSEALFFWCTTILTNFTICGIVISDYRFYFKSEHGLNNYFITQILFVNTFLNIEFFSLMDYYSLVKMEITRYSRYYHFFRFSICYLLYLSSFGLFSYFSLFKNNIEMSLWNFTPILYSVIRYIGSFVEDDCNRYSLHKVLFSDLKIKDVIFIFTIHLLPYFCLLIDKSNSNKDETFYKKSFSLMTLTAMFSFLYGNVTLAKTENRSVMYISYSCVQIMAFGIFSSSKDINHMFFYYDLIIIFCYTVYLLVIVSVLPIIMYIVLNINR
jgi:hypothetical protein